MPKRNHPSGQDSNLCPTPKATQIKKTPQKDQSKITKFLTDNKMAEALNAPKENGEKPPEIQSSLEKDVRKLLEMAGPALPLIPIIQNEIKEMRSELRTQAQSLQWVNDEIEEMKKKSCERDIERNKLKEDLKLAEQKMRSQAHEIEDLRQKVWRLIVVETICCSSMLKKKRKKTVPN